MCKYNGLAFARFHDRKNSDIEMLSVSQSFSKVGEGGIIFL